MKEKKSEECEMGFQWFKWVSKKREIEKGTKNNNAIIPAQDNLKEELGLEKPKNVQASVNSQDGRKGMLVLVFWGKEFSFLGGMGGFVFVSFLVLGWIVHKPFI